jgi:hypothetical protein
MVTVRELVVGESDYCCLICKEYSLMIKINYILVYPLFRGTLFGV